LSPNHPNTTTSYTLTKALGAVRFYLTGGTNAMCGAETPPLKSCHYCLSQLDCGRCHASDINYEVSEFAVRVVCYFLKYIVLQDVLPCFNQTHPSSLRSNSFEKRFAPSLALILGRNADQGIQWMGTKCLLNTHAV
jgi:hypothetical protein